MDVQVAALSAGVSLAVALLTTAGGIRLQRERLRTELRTEFMAEEAIRELLSHQKWKQRSFESIERKIGGFEPDALRQLLVRAGAVRFIGPEGQELWGLRDRNRLELDGEGVESGNG